MTKIIMLPTMSSMIKLSARINGSKNHPSLNIISIFILSVFLLGSCTKDPGQIGYIIQPDDSRLNVKFSDTTSIYAYSNLIDSIRTSQLSTNALGSLQDPVFGSTVAGFYTQFILSAPGEDFGEGRTLDSLVLQLVYADTYGDTLNTIVAHTYEMLKNIDNDSIYYSTFQIPIGQTDYSDYAFSPRPGDSVGTDTLDRLPPMLRLNLTNLSTELGEKLLNADTTDMESSASFQTFFNGLFIQSEPAFDDGAIVFFELSATQSKMILYYHNDEEDSLSYDYIITSSTANVSKYEHSRLNAASDFRAQTVDGDTTMGQEKFYVQGFGGVESIIRFPHIFDWAKRSNVAINEAKLILPGYSEDVFIEAPYQLALLRIDSDSTYTILSDQAEGESYFDGKYNESANGYEFRITRHIQSLINDTTQSNYGLSLFVSGSSRNPNRFIFKGNQQGADTTGIRLEILYTDL